MGYEELLAWVKTHRSVPPVDYEYIIPGIMTRSHLSFASL